MNLLNKKLIIELLTILLLIALWQLFSKVEMRFLSINLLPSPIELWPEIKKIATEDIGIYRDLSISFIRVLISIFFASILGILLALVSCKSKNISQIITNIINIIRPIPNVVWLPILIVIIPSLEIGVIALPLIGALPPIYLSTMSGLAAIPESIKYQSYLNQISEYKNIFHIMIPGSLSHIRNGVNVAIGTAWMGVILAEMMAGKNGIGYFTWISYQSTNYSQMMIGAIAIACLGLATSKLFLKITNKIFRGLYM